MSETYFRAGLSRVTDDESLFWYKPPDAPRTGGKPCDYMVWIRPSSPPWPLTGPTPTPAIPFWFEIKSTGAVGTFWLGHDLRPSQLAAANQAARIGIPYWAGVWWVRHKVFTFHSLERHLLLYARELVLDRSTLNSDQRMEAIKGWHAEYPGGIDADRARLPSVLRSILRGEVD